MYEELSHTRSGNFEPLRSLWFFGFQVEPFVFGIQEPKYYRSSISYALLEHGSPVVPVREALMGLVRTKGFLIRKCSKWNGKLRTFNYPINSRRTREEHIFRYMYRQGECAVQTPNSHHFLREI